jgi:protein-S-isoprenylcysteine O-methyltransferase Ste14
MVNKEDEKMTEDRVADYMRVKVPPPLVFLALAGLGVGLHLVHPLRLLPQGRIALGIGLPVIGIGTVVLIASIQSLRRAGTDHTGLRPSTSIVRQGPYRWSRNPMYFGPILWLIGLAFAVNTIWLLGLTLPLFLYFDRWVIQMEEQYLENKFGDEYLEYRSSVRRWI